MTRCEFTRENERITRFSVSGHSGYAESGQDIVCAAISAVVAMVEATVNDVCGAKAKVRVKEEDARITLTLPAVCDEEESVHDAEYRCSPRRTICATTATILNNWA